MKELRPLSNFTEQSHKIQLKYIVPFDFGGGGVEMSLLLELFYFIAIDRSILQRLKSPLAQPVSLWERNGGLSQKGVPLLKDS